MKKVILLSIVVFGLLTLTGCEGWATNRAGRNMIREAEFNAQQMQIEADALIYYERTNAEAIVLRAQAEADAEVIRARGMAEAMEIIKQEITDDYIRHLWVRSLAENNNVIYVATEMGLPIFPSGVE
jgi:ATP-dependent protease HslVU (ClpYQ) peptidase subunit